MNKIHKLKIRNNLETYILTIIFLVLTIILFRFNEVRFFTLATDSAGYVDLIRAVAENGTMVSSIFSSFYSAIPLLAAPSDIYCSSPLLSDHRTSNFLQWHPYLITYALAFPVKYFGITPLEIAAFINAINISASITLIYWYLRKKELMIWETLSFIFAIAITDYWMGSLVGQFYFDRLFILPGLVLVLFCYEKWDGNYRIWLSISLLAMLSSLAISERTALLASVITFGFWLLLKERHFKKQNITLLLFSAIGLIYFMIYMKFFQNSAYYAGVNFSTILHNLNLALSPSGTLFDRTMIWFGIVSPMVILTFINWRYGLLVVVAMMPNLLVSVGGAEKTGFSTHYHAVYIPFLIGFATIGYATLINKVRQHNFLTTTRFNKAILTVLIPAAVILSGIGVSNFKESLQSYLTIIGVTSAYNSMITKKEDFSNLVDIIPENEWISSPESTMPILAVLGKTNIDYMPIGLGSNRYIIANYNLPSRLPDITSYLDPLTKEQISICIQDKLDNHYKIKLEKIISGSRYVIYEKTL